jgi:hypothetical protein
VALVRTDVSEGHIIIIRVTRNGKLGTTLKVTSKLVFIHNVLRLLVTANVVHSLLILFTLVMKAIRSSEILVLSKAIWCKVPEDGILHSHCHENFISYMFLCGTHLKEIELNKLYGVPTSLAV